MIYPSAIIDKTAEIAANVEIGPWTIIGPDVIIGEGSRIASHVVIKGPTVIGRDNLIMQFSSIGEDTPDRKYRGEKSRLEIGDRNIIREGCSIHRGTAVAGNVTRIGNDNLIMGYVHIAHDCQVGNFTTFANYAALAGHVVVDDHVNFGGYAAVHQFCHVGTHAFIANRASVTQDVLPYVLITGAEETHTCGLNTVGLKRHGFSDETITILKRAYKVIFRQGLSLQDAIDQLQLMLPEEPKIQLLIDGLQRTTRGIIC